jgi:hypothetical protein
MWGEVFANSLFNADANAPSNGGERIFLESAAQIDNGPHGFRPASSGRHQEDPMKIIAPLIVYFFVTGCAATSANSPAPPSSAATGKTTTAVKPDGAMAIKHLREHVKYPASRTVVLAACADTPEFSAEEKKWIADSLPERIYGSADEVAVALHL